MLEFTRALLNPLQSTLSSAGGNIQMFVYLNEHQTLHIGKSLTYNINVTVQLSKMFAFSLIINMAKRLENHNKLKHVFCA